MADPKCIETVLNISKGELVKGELMDADPEDAEEVIKAAVASLKKVDGENGSGTKEDSNPA